MNKEKKKEKKRFKVEEKINYDRRDYDGSDEVEDEEDYM